MKSLLFLIFLSFSSIAVQAQQLSFNETIKYINDIFSENKCLYVPKGSSVSYDIGGITVNKAGKITIYDEKIANNISTSDTQIAIINLFDIGKISQEKDMENTNYVRFADTAGNYVGKIYINQLNGGRVIKALDYLKGLCQKPVDPFGN